jgi:hypothetical protein
MTGLTELTFRIDDVVAETYAAAPQLTARLQVSEGSGATVHAIALRSVVRIEPQKRAYSDDESRGMADQFGTRDRWSQTLKPFQWMQCSTMVQGFSGSTLVDVPMPVTYDLEVTASRYLHALGDDGDVPLNFLFAGTVFTRGDGGFAVEQVPWHLEANYRMPVEVWRTCMQLHFPNAGWLRLHRDTLAELSRVKATLGLTSWDEVVTRLVTASADELRERTP